MNKALISLMVVLLFVVGACGGDDAENFPNERAGLNWSDASSSSMSWYDAVDYCENLGGRLPTISELRTLIQNCPGIETGGACKVTDSCLSYYNCWNALLCRSSGSDKNNPGKYSVFGDSNRFWSSSELSDFTDSAWYVCFIFGDVFYHGKNSDVISVRCVQ